MDENTPNRNNPIAKNGGSECAKDLGTSVEPRNRKFGASRDDSKCAELLGDISRSR